MCSRVMIASAVTNLDLHDIARAARTYAVDGVYVVTPLEDQRALVERLPGADLLSHLGDLQARQGKLDAASRHYDLALGYDSFHAGAVSGLAAVRDLEGRLEEAAVLHREAIALEPLTAEPYLRFGRHLISVAQSGLPDAASAAAHRAPSRGAARMSAPCSSWERKSPGRGTLRMA